jgi:dihydropteroate synthase
MPAIDFSRPLVMGILNLSPDSFYDGGKYTLPESALLRAKAMIEQGASIIDLGAVSTRPGSIPPSEAEEWARLEPALQLIRTELPDAILSVDTYRSQIAEKAANLGVAIINDISGGTMDAHMFETVARLQLHYVLMHIQGTPETMQMNPQYEDVVNEVKSFFAERIKQLNAVGFDKIILDPGFGFGKTVEHNFDLLESIGEFAAMGYPVLAGLSRKSMIMKSLGVSKENALNGTTILNTIALMKGAKILRVHDVTEAVEVVKLLAY